MLKPRLFNIMIAIALAILIALTVREAAATAGMLSQPGAVRIAKVLECASLPSRYSIRTEYVKGADMLIIRSEDGPTGVDGGLVELLSSYRTCK